LGAFGKLFSEAIEATPARERETIIASGGGPWMGVRFGLLPQVLPVITSLPGDFGRLIPPSQPYRRRMRVAAR
jgi:hypothetical protein